jgi:hypothetical protein
MFALHFWDRVVSVSPSNLIYTRITGVGIQMKIDILFIDTDLYLITIDEIPIGPNPVTIGEAIIIKKWLQKNVCRLEGFFRQREGIQILREMKLWSETRG